MHHFNNPPISAMRYSFITFWCATALLCGCSCWDALTVRSQSPDEEAILRQRVKLVGDLAVPYNMFPVKVEAVGLVVGLNGTGSDPAPSPQRAALLSEMQTRGVEKPNAVLASPNTALVLVRGVLRPGVQKGDRFDVEVRIPSRSETTSLRGGRLLQTRLRELAVLDDRVHGGQLLGLAEGAVLVDPSAEGTDHSVLAGRGRVLGGGVILKNRPLGLVLKPEHKSVLNASRIATAVNRRFHTFTKGIKTGVAKAQTDEYIRLEVHPRYKDNIQRYVQVVRSIALYESATERTKRLALLEKQLLNPISSSNAARQLEAIGPQSREVLTKGIEDSDPEVRFWAAEALAYLDQSEAAEPLAEVARDEPAFRVFALTALSAMDDFHAYEQLSKLLSVPSAETRYGAFRALWAMNPHDALVLGEMLGGEFNYHVLNTTGPPMVHVTRSHRPEVVVFGQNQRLRTPLALEAGNEILVTSSKPDQVVVSRFAVGKPDLKSEISNRVDEVIRTIVELGGTYPDVVQALQQAKTTGALEGRFEVDAIPQAGRRYDRIAEGEEGETEFEENPPSGFRLLGRNPLPNLFDFAGGGPHSAWGNREKSVENSPDMPDSNTESPPKKSFFAKIMGRDSE